jgi:hypothetical protein
MSSREAGTKKTKIMSNKKHKSNRPLRPPVKRTSAVRANFAFRANSAVSAAATATSDPSVRPAVPSHASVVEAIEAAIEATRELAGERLREKLSISRLMGVSRELRELLKVMSVYRA